MKGVRLYISFWLKLFFYLLKSSFFLFLFHSWLSKTVSVTLFHFIKFSTRKLWLPWKQLWISISFFVFLNSHEKIKLTSNKQLYSHDKSTAKPQMSKKDVQNSNPMKTFIYFFKQMSHWCLLVMGPGQKFLTRVGSIFCGSGWVGSAIYGLGLNFKNFP